MGHGNGVNDYDLRSCIPHLCLWYRTNQHNKLYP